jgi:hypothetical protein
MADLLLKDKTEAELDEESFIKGKEINHLIFLLVKLIFLLL